MNREIKFRAWHKKANEMLYPEKQSYLFQWLEEGQPIEVMQFTGLKDVHDNDIYEGDLLKFYPRSGQLEQVVFNVFWDDSKAKYSEWHPIKRVEIVGNIYEHHHLLK